MQVCFVALLQNKSHQPGQEIGRGDAATVPSTKDVRRLCQDAGDHLGSMGTFCHGAWEMVPENWETGPENYACVSVLKQMSTTIDYKGNVVSAVWPSSVRLGGLLDRSVRLGEQRNKSKALTRPHVACTRNCTTNYGTPRQLVPKLSPPPRQYQAVCVVFCEFVAYVYVWLHRWCMGARAWTWQAPWYVPCGLKPCASCAMNF